MTDHLGPQGSDDDVIERELQMAAADAEYPPTPPVAEAVRAHLTAETEAGPKVWWRTGARSRGLRPARPLALALVGLLALAATVSAVAFGLPGLRIMFVHTPPSPNVIDDATHIRRSLGTLTDLADARAQLGFPILLPSLGQPDEVYVGNTNLHRQRVVLLYRSHGGPALIGDIGLLVTEFQGDLDQGFDTKWVAQGDTSVEYVPIDGAPGYWFSGAPHVYQYLNEISGIPTLSLRMVGDVLVWQRGDVVYRIESPLGRDATVDIAKGLH